MWQRTSKGYKCLEGFGDNITSVIYSVLEDAHLLEFVAILTSNDVIPNQQHSQIIGIKVDGWLNIGCFKFNIIMIH